MLSAAALRGTLAVPDIRSLRFSFVDRCAALPFASSSPGRAREKPCQLRTPAYIKFHELYNTTFLRQKQGFL